MRSLDDFELVSVAGGDHWGYENSDGSIPESSSNSNAGSYQNSNGSWGATTSTTNICYTATVGPTTSQTCYNSDGTTTVQSCVNAGPSINVGGAGFGVQANICNTTSQNRGTNFITP
jgi:hypothetical protein